MGISYDLDSKALHRLKTGDVDAFGDIFRKYSRKIFLLHFTEDLSNKEIAKRLSVSEENVEMQVRRSLDYLRKHLKKYIASVALLYL